MSAPTTVASLAAALLDGVDVAHTLRLDVGGCRIDIASVDERLVAKLERYFSEAVTDASGEPDFRIVAVEAPELSLDVAWRVKEPDPGKTKIKEEWLDLPDGRVVRKRTTGMVFVFGAELHLAYGPCLANDNQVVNFVNNRYLQWRLAQGYLLAHAGAVGHDGHCLAICGPSGAGKSTAALGLVGAGLDFVTNDRLLLKPMGDGRVYVQGIPKHPRVNPGTILFNPLLTDMIGESERAELLALPSNELRRLEQKYDVLIDEVFGPGRFRMHGTLEALVVLNWTGHGEARARRIDLSERAELLPLITKSPGLFYDAGPGQLEPDLSEARYLETLGLRPVIEITGAQDFDAARRLCLEVLGVADTDARPSASALG
jgi:HprK-related kinase B